MITEADVQAQTVPIAQYLDSLPTPPEQRTALIGHWNALMHLLRDFLSAQTLMQHELAALRRQVDALQSQQRVVYARPRGDENANERINLEVERVKLQFRREHERLTDEVASLRRRADAAEARAQKAEQRAAATRQHYRIMTAPLMPKAQSPLDDIYRRREEALDDRFALLQRVREKGMLQCLPTS